MGKSNTEALGKIAGSWRLVSRTVEFQDTGEKLEQKWIGRFMAQTAGKWSLITMQAIRSAPTTQAEQAAAYNTAIASSGSGTLEGEFAVGRIEFATHPALVGDYRTGIKHVGETMHFTGLYQPSVQWPGRVTRLHTVWERE